MGMQMKKFKASTLQKAIEQVRAELGDGAIILQADPVRDSGLLGRNAVEVTAAIDRKDLPPRFKTKIDNKIEERKEMSKQNTKQALSNFFKSPFSKSKKPHPKTIEKKKTQEAVERLVRQAAGKAGPKKTAKPNTSEPTPSMGQMYAMKTFIEPLKKEISALKESLDANQPKAAGRSPSNAFLESEIQSLRKTLTGYIHAQKYEKSTVPEHIKQLMNFWRSRGMSEAQVYAFFNQLEQEGLQFDEDSSGMMIKPILKKAISGRSSLSQSKQRVVALVGPTGVGKTTSIAKLAAYEKLKLGRSVALVTVDDFKIGGTDQLGHYARILEVPFLKMRSDLSLEEQIKDIQADTVFIDTYGVSPKDDKRIQSLRRTLRILDQELASKLETHLTLPVGIAPGDVETYLEGFDRLAPDYLLFTKWDETENWGGMLATILSSQRPVSFVGNGQEVPDDITIFSSDNFIKMVTEVEV